MAIRADYINSGPNLKKKYRIYLVCLHKTYP